MGWTQRQYPRFRATLPIELRPKGTSAPLRAQTTDICLGGCYVEMIFTQEISTAVDIALWIGDLKLAAKGEIVSKHPSFGNGLKFTKLTEENQGHLSHYLDSLKPLRQRCVPDERTKAFFR